MTVIGVTDMERAVTFWTQALGFEIHIGGADDGWTELGPPGEDALPLALQHSDEQPEVHPRLHLDLMADDAGDQTTQVERLTSLGATRVDWDLYPATPDFVVLADPDGNRFCVVDAAMHEG